MTAIVTAITHRRKTFIIGPERIPEGLHLPPVKRRIGFTT